MTEDTWKFLINVATVGATVFAGFGLWQTSKGARAEAQATTYSALDDTYRELLAIAVDKPSFRDPQVTKGYPGTLKGNDRIAYEAYAFSVWNFIETVFDRCKNDQDLKDTWIPVVTSENALHRNWFESDDSQGKFKQLFRDIVKQETAVFPVNRDEPGQAALKRSA